MKTALLLSRILIVADGSYRPSSDNGNFNPLAKNMSDDSLRIQIDLVRGTNLPK